VCLVQDGFYHPVLFFLVISIKNFETIRSLMMGDKNDKRSASQRNIKDAKLQDINVIGYEGPLFSTFNVSRSGLNGEATLESPELSRPINEPAEKYKPH
jgi:hypothetical protein